MIRYGKLFEVKLFHAFYNQFGSRDMGFLLTPDTRRYLSELHLIYKQTSEGFIVLYNQDKKYLMENLKKECVFRFGIYATNRYFVNFSDLPSRTAIAKHLLRNTQTTTSHEGEHTDPSKHIQLHVNTTLGEETIVSCCAPATLLYKTLSNEELKISQGDDIYFEGELNDRYTASTFLHSNYGVYDVIFNASGETKEMHFVPDMLEQAFALMDIELGGENTSFNALNGTCYYVKIGNRPVTSNYYFISRQQKEFESIAVRSGKKTLPYTTPQKVKLVNGQEAMHMKSLETSLLEKKNSQSITAELIIPPDSEHELEEKKKINLPKPDITKIKAMIDGGEEAYFSDMYVYL